MSTSVVLCAEKQLKKPTLRKARCFAQTKLRELHEREQTGRQPKPLKRRSLFKKGNRRWSVWEEGTQANRMIRIWQGQQKKEWELCSMSMGSTANIKLQEPLARAFFHPLFCTRFEEEEALCSGNSAMAAKRQKATG